MELLRLQHHVVCSSCKLVSPVGSSGGVGGSLNHRNGFGSVESTGCSICLARRTGGRSPRALLPLGALDVSRGCVAPPPVHSPCSWQVAGRALGLRAAGCGCGARGLFLDFAGFHVTCFRARQQLGLPRASCAGRRGIRSQTDVWGTRFFQKTHFAPI